MTWNVIYLVDPHIKRNERVTAVITARQRATLERIARDAQFNGIKKQRRITANSVIRAMLELLNDFDSDLSCVKTEDDLKKLFQLWLLKNQIGS